MKIECVKIKEIRKHNKVGENKSYLDVKINVTPDKTIEYIDLKFTVLPNDVKFEDE